MFDCLINVSIYLRVINDYSAFEIRFQVFTDMRLFSIFVLGWPGCQGVKIPLTLKIVSVSDSVFYIKGEEKTLYCQLRVTYISQCSSDLEPKLLYPRRGNPRRHYPWRMNSRKAINMQGTQKKIENV